MHRGLLCCRSLPVLFLFVFFSYFRSGSGSAGLRIFPLKVTIGCVYCCSYKEASQWWRCGSSDVTQERQAEKGRKTLLSKLSNGCRTVFAIQLMLRHHLICVVDALVGYVLKVFVIKKNKCLRAPVRLLLPS